MRCQVIRCMKLMCPERRCFVTNLELFVARMLAIYESRSGFTITTSYKWIQTGQTLITYCLIWCLMWQHLLSGSLLLLLPMTFISVNMCIAPGICQLWPVTVNNINQSVSSIEPLLFIYDLSCQNMSRIVTKQTKWHVRPTKTQISLGIRPVWSESSLCA